MRQHFSTAYKQDLTSQNERFIACANHPDKPAKAIDGSVDGEPVPLCETCYLADWPAIRLRLAAQRLILGGLR